LVIVTLSSCVKEDVTPARKERGITIDTILIETNDIDPYAGVPAS